MADPNDNPNDNPNDDPAEEVTLESVVDVAPEDLTDDQKTVLNENADDLTDEQKETFKDVLEKKEEPIDADEVKVETRTEPKKKPEEPEPDEEEVDPEDEKTIGKIVDKRLGAVTDDLRATKDQLEVDALLRDRPELSKYRGVILKHMKHPAYQNIPAHNIAAMVAAKDQQAIGAKKEREAADKANKTKGGGTSARKPGGGAIDWAKATPEEVAAQKNKILGRQV